MRIIKYYINTCVPNAYGISAIQSFTNENVKEKNI